jgi:hypothetical protein
VPDRPQLTWSKDCFEGVAVGDDTIGCTYCHAGRLPTGKATNRQIPPGLTSTHAPTADHGKRLGRQVASENYVAALKGASIMLDRAAQAASDFLVEALAVFEMTQRGFTELLSTLGSDQHHAQDIQTESQQQEALERATGVLMERHGLSADTAAERIRQTAARQGITVSEAAARLLRQPPAQGRHRSGR